MEFLEFYEFQEFPLKSCDLYRKSIKININTLKMVKSGARDKARRRGALAIDRKLPVRRREHLHRPFLQGNGEGP